MQTQVDNRLATSPPYSMKRQKKAQQELLTSYEQYMNLPEGAPYQLIGGNLIMTPSPVPCHQYIVGHIYSFLLQFVEQKNIGQVFVAPLDVRLDDDNIFQPDILFSAGTKSLF